MAKTGTESTEKNIDVIAHHSGFETAMAMRHNFRKYMGLSPSSYRKQFTSGRVDDDLRLGFGA